MKKLIGLLAFTVLFVLQLSAERTFEIRLLPQSIDCETNEFCYDVQIKGGQDILWRFAGQNYRLFYNGALAEFTRVIPVLEQPYSSPEVVQDIQHLDLSAQGNLPFDEDLSWLNYFIDMNVAFPGNIISPDVWTTTSTICFNSLVDMMGDPDICFEMVWAREELTFNYATAFVEISEWVAESSTNDHVSGSVYYDLNSESGDAACFDLVCGDNPPSYDAKITLKSNDPDSNTSCFAIEVKSANSRTWTLGDHEFSILFDGSQADYISASSSISGAGELVNGETLENLDFSDGSGNISFESNISAFSISVSQGDSEIVIGDSYTEIAEFCLDLSNELTDGCFEIVLGRDGLTNEYFSSITQLLQAQGEVATQVSVQDYNRCSESECEDLDPPVSNGDITICEGDDIPILSVEEQENLIIRWFETPVGGTALAQGSTYGPSGPGIFYAEIFDETKNCFSERTSVALVEVPLPEMNVISKACLSDQSTYSIRFTTDASNVIADRGNVEKLVGLEWMVSGVISGEDVTITLSNDQTNCNVDIVVDAPNCECQLVSSPISGGDLVACLADEYPALTVDVIQENMTADWYTRVEGGTPIATERLEYTPTNVNKTGVYTYYVQARSLENGCESPMRTPISLTVLDPPVYAFVGASCDDDLSTYSATFYSDASLISTDEGSLIGDDNGVWRLTEVPTGIDVVLNITSPTGCTIQQTISTPQCECEHVEAPICEGEYTICEGMDYPGFKAFAYHGKSVRWYDEPTGGTLLAEGNTFKPTISGSYYAEAIDSITGCTSQQRTEVTLLISPVPYLQVNNTVLCDGETISWADLVEDLNDVEGVVSVYSDFRDAMNEENAITESSFVVAEITSYFIRKTTATGCFDIETIIVVPEQCGSTCLADAGEYVAANTPCYDGDLATLELTEVVPPGIPTDFVQGFIITLGPEKEVYDITENSSYVVDKSGEFRMHSFVFLPFDPALDSIISEDGISLEDLGAVLASGGGPICGALDTEGVLFQVEVCDNMCQASSGSVIAQDIECLENEEPIELRFEMNPLDAVVPEGFEQIFVLTSGPDLVIMGAGNEAFFVEAEGEYRVHSLVFDPLTLDLSIVEPGVTTGFDVNALLLQGGGTICGSLDVDGAQFNVEKCAIPCDAEAGETIASNSPCIDEISGIAILEVDVTGEVLPVGYEQAYIFTSGPELFIFGIEVDPIFFVQSPGSFKIHSFVYDPVLFDISSISTTFSSANEIYALTVEGGGQMCASIDLNGAQFDIEGCPDPCFADSGNTDALNASCLEEGGSVTLEIQNDDAVIPDGYTQLFVLTSGPELIIQGAQVENFEVSTLGQYQVHSLVFDPETLDLTGVVPGVTSASEVLSMLQQGGGDVCGFLEIEGANFIVEECDTELIDLELTKDISNMNPSTGEEITFTIEVFNNSNTTATGVSIVDNLPPGYMLTGNISHNGAGEITNNGGEVTDNSTEISWSNLTLAPGEIVLLSFMAKVNENFSQEEYKNVAQVTSADQDDIDSTPNNDDGDQSEDDEDHVTPNISIAQIDLELVKTVNTPTVQAGDAVLFNLNLSNRAMTEATGIEVVDILPDGIDPNSVESISNDGRVEGNTVIWSDLEMGFLSTLNLSFVAVVGEAVPEGDLVNTAQVTAADQPDLDSTPNNDDGDQSEDDESRAVISVTVPLIDLSLTKEVSNPTPIPGETIAFEITVNNNGEVPATGVTVTDMLPMTGYDINSISNVDPTGQVAGNTIVWSLDEIAPNDEAILSFSVVVTPDGTDYKNVAQVTAANEQDVDSTPNNDDGDQSEDDEDSAMVTLIVDEQFVDIEVEKSVSDLAPEIGETVQYTVVVSNEGMIDATNLLVQDVTPDGIDALDVTGENTQGDGVITWTIDVLEPGESMTFTYSSIVFESLIDDYTNVVQLIAVDQEDIDSAPANDDGDQSEDDEDSATIFPTIREDIDLELSKFVNNNCASADERVTFTLELFNRSDVLATGVSIEDIFSDGYVNIEDISNGGTLDGSTISWSNLSVLPNETISLTYSAMVSATGSSFVNIAQVTAADQNDIDSSPNNDDGDQSEDDEASIEMSGGSMFDLELEKIVDNPYAQPGDRVRFDIIIRNVGCTDATGVAVRDIIPGGFKSIRNITELGIRNANIITWEDLEVAAGSSLTLTFTAEVVHFSINCDYMNIAEIIAADQTDVDSTPDNDDGDQSEDDEDMAEVLAGTLADLYLTMTSDVNEVETGDIVTYTISLCNNGPANAFGVQVKDYLPSGISVVGDINYKGELSGQEITWSGFTVTPGTCADLEFQAEILDASTTVDILNEAEIVLSDQLDPDSSPGNRDTSEDDYASVVITQFVALPANQAEVPNMMEVSLNTALFLEGAYNSQTGQLNTTLNDLGYLPGQRPESFFAEMTPAGQPYNSAPWNYEGEEGMVFNSQADFSIEYPVDVVDWVLVSIREDINGNTTVAKRAALLMKDGTVSFAQDSEPILLDANKSYYLLIQHRNHLPILSPHPLEIKDGELSFDFRTNESYIGLLGSGQKDVNGTYCVFAANGDQFRNALSQYDINVVDMDMWFKSNGKNSSYMIADFDMNGDVNVNDQIMWLLNNGIFSDIPR